MNKMVVAVVDMNKLDSSMGNMVGCIVVVVVAAVGCIVVVVDIVVVGIVVVVLGTADEVWVVCGAIDVRLSFHSWSKLV